RRARQRQDAVPAIPGRASEPVVDVVRASMRLDADLFERLVVALHDDDGRSGDAVGVAVDRNDRPPSVSDAPRLDQAIPRVTAADDSLEYTVLDRPVGVYVDEAARCRAAVQHHHAKEAPADRRQSGYAIRVRVEAAVP